MQAEERDLVRREAVFLDQRRSGLAVDHRHLALEADQQPGQRLDERAMRLAVAPALQAQRLGEQLAVDLRVEDLLARLAARFREIQQEGAMADRLRLPPARPAPLLPGVLQP